MRETRSTHGQRNSYQAIGLVGMRCRVVFLCLAIDFVARPDASAQSAETRAWLEDLAVLERELPRRHVSPAIERPLEAFQADVAGLRTRIPALPREAIIMEFIRLAASFGDSHTELSLGQARVGFHRFPIGLYFFANDLRVVVTDQGNEDLLGLRLVGIGGHSVKHTLDRIKPVLADDFGNPYEALHSGPSFVMIPEVLVGLALVPPDRPIEYVFEADDGRRVARSFAPVPLRSAAQVMTVRFLKPGTEPLSMRDRDQWYVMTRVKASNLLYVRVSRSQDQHGRESLAALASRVAGAATLADVREVIVDIRQNTGGNFYKTEPLGGAICRAVNNGELDRAHVILGRHTYSAAIVFAAQLRHGCSATFVGEVPRAAPNRQADVASFTLPNSKLEVTYSSRLRPAFPELGDATELPLDRVVPVTWERYRVGRDPALEFILSLPSQTNRRKGLAPSASQQAIFRRIVSGPSQ